MNEIIKRVFLKKEEIIQKTMNYQNSSMNCDSGNHSKEYSMMYDYFDQHFGEDEIKVIQSIMYFGRECYTGSGSEYTGTKEEIISFWMKALGFILDRKINKDVEICQMIGKAQKIGDYFKYGFEELEKI